MAIWAWRDTELNKSHDMGIKDTVRMFQNVSENNTKNRN